MENPHVLDGSGRRGEVVELLLCDAVGEDGQEDPVRLIERDGLIAGR